MGSSINWRIYRDRAAAPVPVLRRRADHTVYRFIPVTVFTGDTVVVEPYITATGLYSGRVWENGSALPSEVMRDEPVILDLVTPYGGRTTKLAVAVRFEGAGPNRYMEARIVDIDEVAHVLIPPHPSETLEGLQGTDSVAHPIFRATPLGGQVFDAGIDVTDTRTFVARWLGRKAYQIPAGFPDLHYVTVAGAHHTIGIDYDPYHGVVVLDNAREGQQVLVTVKLRYRMTRPIEVAANSIRPVYVRDSLYGYVTRTSQGEWEDARRMPTPTGGSRVGSMYFDGEPISTGHLWILDTDGDLQRVRNAVRRAMPAGTVYRQVNGYNPAAPQLVSPIGGAQVSAVTFRWAAFETASQYELEVATDTDFTTVVFSTNGLTDTEYAWDDDGAAVYYWRVRAASGSVVSPWSSTESVEVV